MAKSKTLVGQYFEIPAGITVYRAGQKTTQSRDTVVCVRRESQDNKGNTRIYWKSNGLSAYTTL